MTYSAPPRVPSGRCGLLTTLPKPPVPCLKPALWPKPPHQPRFLSPASYALLEAGTNRLSPQPERAALIGLASALDQRLADGRGDGWRYSVLPQWGICAPAGA